MTLGFVFIVVGALALYANDFRRYVHRTPDQRAIDRLARKSRRNTP